MAQDGFLTPDPTVAKLLRQGRSSHEAGIQACWRHKAGHVCVNCHSSGPIEQSGWRSPERVASQAHAHGCDCWLLLAMRCVLTCACLACVC
jgi:hypothetical protein